jgi:hypothetical protein
MLGVLDPVTTGEAVGKMGAEAILGVISVSCVIALVRLYRDKETKAQEHDNEMKVLIQESTKAMTESANACRVNTEVMVEVKDAIIRCKGPKQ